MNLANDICSTYLSYEHSRVDHHCFAKYYDTAGITAYVCARCGLIVDRDVLEDAPYVENQDRIHVTIRPESVTGISKYDMPLKTPEDRCYTRFGVEYIRICGHSFLPDEHGDFTCSWCGTFVKGDVIQGECLV